MTAPSEALAWQAQRHEECNPENAEVWFPQRGGSSKDAKAICNECPVRAQCLRYALDNHETFGIWGGVGERERRRLRKIADDLSDAELLAMTAQPVRVPRTPKVAVRVRTTKATRSRPKPRLQLVRADGKKVCRTCDCPKDQEEFCRRQASPDGRDSRCKDCSNADARALWAQYQSVAARLRKARAS